MSEHDNTNILSKIQSFGGESSDTLDGRSTQVRSFGSDRFSIFHSEVSAPEEVFTLTEVRDTKGVYYERYLSRTHETGLPIHSQRQLKYPCTVHSDRLKSFIIDRETYYFSEHNLKPAPHSQIEASLVNGDTHRVKLFDGENFLLSPEQSSNLMARYRQFFPIIQEESDGSVSIVIGEIK